MIKVAFTFIGTVVGAGFASGQEVLQFFTQYGEVALYTLGLSCVLFICFGIRLMCLAHDLSLHSYDQLNQEMFGNRLGNIVNILTLLMLLGSLSVMLAGGGTLLLNQFHFPFTVGLAIILLLAYFVLSRGIHAIMNINSIVVPIMFIFVLGLIVVIWSDTTLSNISMTQMHHTIFPAITAPFLYTAYNLAMAQAVLVPLGASIQDRTILIGGGILGALGIGFLMYATHYILSTKMPYILTEEIPIASFIILFGKYAQILYTLILLSEILTTLIANGFGLTLQLKSKTNYSFRKVAVMVLIFTFCTSHFGFKALLTFLYPIFGWISLCWLCMLLIYRLKRVERTNYP